MNSSIREAWEMLVKEGYSEAETDHLLRILKAKRINKTRLVIEFLEKYCPIPKSEKEFFQFVFPITITEEVK